MLKDSPRTHVNCELSPGDSDRPRYKDGLFSHCHRVIVNITDDLFSHCHRLIVKDSEMKGRDIKMASFLTVTR